MKILPLTTEEIKKLVGQEVWCVPQGNSIRRGSSSDNYNTLKKQIFSDTIIKCGTKNFSLKNKGSFKLSNYSDDNNYGYKPFRTSQDALDYVECEEVNAFIRSINTSNLSADDIRKIREIVVIADKRNDSK